jgi:hypothetical protein
MNIETYLPEDCCFKSNQCDYTSGVTSKAANGGRVKTGQRMRLGTSFFYPVLSCSGKFVFVRQLRGPHFRM